MNPNGEDVTGFLKLDFSGDIPRETKSLRMALLAEMLVNLQDVTGFKHPIAQMRAGQIESGFAELEFGKLLFINDVNFRFVDPHNRKAGEAYDYEIIYPDAVLACADAKCKIESGEPSVTSIRHSLDTARRQLPADKPGIIFVKVPQAWFERPEIGAELGNLARQFFNGTRRIASVKYYVSYLQFVHEGILNTHRYREVSNPRNRFDPSRNWALFKSDNAPSDWNGLPAKWIRLVNFPEGLR